MNRFFSTLALAFTSLIERPLRTLLTSLGIIIGVAAVFAMLAIGEGSRRAVLEQLNSASTRTVSIYQDWDRRGRASQSRPRRPFSETDVLEMRNIPGVTAATGSLDRNANLISETADWSSTVRGTDPDYLLANDFTLTAGEGISFVDVDQNATVAVVGQTVARTLYRDQNPIGQRLKVDNIPFIIKGVVGPTDQQNWGGRDPDDFVLIPTTTARNRIMGGNTYVTNYVDSIQVVANSTDALPRIQQEIDVVLRRSRGLKANDAPDYRVFNFAANINAAAEASRVLSMLLAAMGTVSLVVGGVGVMNIMLVSVTERTREIGLRMALGARRSDIMSQFMSEALMLCLFGGLVGLAVGYSTSFLPIENDDLKLVFSQSTALLAFGSAMLIGVVFGVLPARRASRLNPIEALRHE